MKVIKIYLNVYLLLCSTYVFSKYKEKAEHFWSPINAYQLKTSTIIPKTFTLGLIGNYFSTSGYFNENGESTPLEDDASFSKSELEVIGGYGFGEKFDITTGLKYRTQKSSNGYNEVSTSGIESIFIEGKYRLDFNDQFKFAMMMNYRQKMYENDPETSGIGQEKMILGDDGHVIIFGGYLSYLRTKVNAFTGGLGYRMFSSEQSTDFPWMLETSWVKQKFAFILGVRGTFSMNEDDGSARLAYNQGVTSLYNGINPSFTAPYIGLNFLSGSARFSIELSQRIMGASTDQGYAVTLGLVWNSSNEQEKERIKIHSFKEYSVEAKVIKVSPRGLFIKVDKGISSEVEKGETADIYFKNYLGGNVLVASGLVYDTGVDWAIIKVAKRYKKVKMKEGFVVRFK